MDWTIRERGDEGAAGWLEQAVKLVIALRAAALLLTVLYRPNIDHPELLVAAVLLAALASFVPLKFWDRVGPRLVRHPGYLAAEIVLATLILVLTGVESPFYSYTLGTALLGGLLYGWPGAALFAPMHVGVYFWVVDVRKDVETLPHSFQLQIGLPALYLIAGAAGAVARGLLDRIATAEAELADHESAAAAERERGRLARDMHDSLAKTVHGIGFAALALSRRIERNPEAAVLDARQLAEDANKAAQEARDLIAGLRERQESDRSPGAALRVEAQTWSSASGVPVKLRAEEIDDLPPVAARELRWILKEALRNVTRHAPGTQRVVVTVRRLGGRVVLAVRDDGPGFEVPEDLATLSADRHYGLVGMRERAQVAGGDLMVESAPGEGCTISAWVPAAAPETPRSPAADPPPAAAPAPAQPAASAEPSRTVSGFQWQ
jgi:signal transduction histidine kinase